MKRKYNKCNTISFASDKKSGIWNAGWLLWTADDNEKKFKRDDNDDYY